MQTSDVFRSKFICLKVKAPLPNDRKYSINIIYALGGKLHHLKHISNHKKDKSTSSYKIKRWPLFEI